MNLDKVEKQLRKISNMVASLKEDDQVSAIERDLLLSYTRSLYEKMLGDEGATPKSENPAIIVEQPSPARQAKPTQSSRPMMEEIVKEEIDQPVMPVEEVKPPVENIVPAVTATPQSVSNGSAATATTVVVEEEDMPQSMKEIFSESRINELSDKLSHSPIKDLSKSMGINEKIFTIQELFGGDSNLFTTTMSRLNQFENFNDAKSYLVKGVAKDQRWDEGDKQKKAINFIKLVQRRFA